MFAYLMLVCTNHTVDGRPFSGPAKFKELVIFRIEFDEIHQDSGSLNSTIGQVIP